MTHLASAGLALAVFLTGFPVALPAQAHFTEPVPMGWDDWSMRQFNLQGTRCCDPTDVYLYKGAWHYEYRGDEIAGVTLDMEDGRAIFVPQARFVDRTRDPDDINPTGSSVIWYREITNMWCFDPPGALG